LSASVSSCLGAIDVVLTFEEGVFEAKRSLSSLNFRDTAEGVGLYLVQLQESLTRLASEKKGNTDCEKLGGNTKGLHLRLPMIHES
jgi:hypothetical protein